MEFQSSSHYLIWKFFCSAFERFIISQREEMERVKRFSNWNKGRNTAAEFALTFRTLAAQTGWPDDPLKLHFLQGIEPGVADWTRLSRRGKNFGSTDWSFHSHQQNDSLQETQQGFYFPFTKPSSCAWARGHARGIRTHLSWGKKSPVSSKSLSLLWLGRSCENLLSNQTQAACFLCGRAVI